MSDLVGNPEDRFSHNEAHIILNISVVKEKLHLHRPLIEAIPVTRNCEYQNICLRIKAQLSLPGRSCLQSYYDNTFMQYTAKMIIFR